MVSECSGSQSDSVFPSSKVCSGCKLDKPLGEFYRHQNSKYGRASKCKQCVCIRVSEYRTRNDIQIKENKKKYAQENKEWLREKQRDYWRDPERRDRLKEQHRSYKLAKRYGLSMEQYFSLLDRCNGACEICGATLSRDGANGTRRMAIDHDHNTGQVRGILCRACNTSVGVLGDDISGLKRALAYLTRSKQRETVDEGDRQGVKHYSLFDWGKQVG